MYKQELWPDDDRIRAGGTVASPRAGRYAQRGRAATRARKQRVATVLLVGLHSVVTPADADDKAPEVDQVIAQHLKAIGGQELLKNLRSYRATGRSSSSRTDGGVHIVWKRPNLLRYAFEHSAGVITLVYDGKKAWGKVAQGGSSQVLEQPPLATAVVALDADFAGLLVDYRSKGCTAELRGLESVGERTAHKIHVQQGNGSEHDYFVDNETYMLLRVDRKVVVGGEKALFEHTFDNYKRVDGLLLAHTMVVRGDVGDSHTELTKIELNVEVEKQLFDRLREDD